jgi:outer membrane protein OmpA-like peptidoglycan-associated protein
VAIALVAGGTAFGFRGQREPETVPPRVAATLPVKEVKATARFVSYAAVPVRAAGRPVRAPVIHGNDEPRPPTVPDDVTMTITLRPDVLFRFRRWRLTQNGRARVAQAVATMERLAPIRWIHVAGHTDSRGRPRRNLRLSRRRARTVARALRAARVPGHPRIRRFAFGEARPIAPNIRPSGADNRAGRKLNRRVVIKFKPAA